MLSKAPTEGAQRKAYTSKKLEDPTQAEIVSFNKVKTALTTPKYLVHADPKGRTVYSDVDACHEFEIGVMLYHVKDSVALQPGEWPKRTDIESILFLSRLLHPAEKRYYPTELEVAGMVWAIRKCRHIVKLAALPMQVFTDHGTGIVRQRSLETESIDRANIRLVRASNYLQ
jgi:hypothetical protein